MREKVLFAWSGGKDSAIALYEIQRRPEYEIVALLTTVNEAYNRISSGIGEMIIAAATRASNTFWKLNSGQVSHSRAQSQA